RAFLNKNLDWESKEFYINHILNITIVDDFLHKREIGAKPPSRYMKAFRKTNKELGTTMKTHLINDLDKFGIWNDDYETFITKRASAVSSALKKRIIQQDTDRSMTAEAAVYDDVSDEDTGLWANIPA